MVNRKIGVYEAMKMQIISRGSSNRVVRLGVEWCCECRGLLCVKMDSFEITAEREESTGLCPARTAIVTGNTAPGQSA